MSSNIYHKLRELSKNGWVIQISASENYFFVKMKKEQCFIISSHDVLDTAIDYAYTLAREEYYP